MKLRRNEMTEDQADMWKKAPTKEEWVNWGMANNSRAVICVERIVNGKVEWLPIDNQGAHREWVGCFSLLR
jgi:hypothetical protein